MNAARKSRHILAVLPRKVPSFFLNDYLHGLRTPGEEIAFTAGPKIHSHSQIFSYGRSIFYLPYRPKISDFFDRVSVVRDCLVTKLITKNQRSSWLKFHENWFNDGFGGLFFCLFSSHLQYKCVVTSAAYLWGNQNILACLKIGILN